MRRTAIGLLMLLVLAAPACRRETQKEQKITINIEGSTNRPLPARLEQPESRPGIPAGKQDAEPTEVKPPDVSPEKAREIIEAMDQLKQTFRDMTDKDPRIPELCKEGDAGKLSKYLLKNYPETMKTVAGTSKINDERLVSFFIARSMIRKHKFAEEKGLVPERRDAKKAGRL